MFFRRMIGLATCVTAMIIGGASYAEECADLYRYDTTELRENLALHVAFLKSIDSSNWSERRKGFDSSMGVIFEGIPMEGTGNFEDFEKARSKYLEKFKFNMDETSAKKISRAYVNNESAKNVALCLRNKSLAQRGFHAWLTEVQGNRVFVEMYWNPTVGGGALEVEVNVTGGTLLSDKRIVLPPNGFSSAELKREGPSTDFQATIKPVIAGERTQYVFVPVLPKVVVVPKKKVVVAKPSARDKIMAAFEAGKTCTMRLTIPGNQYCLGTLVRGGRSPYKITYLKGGKWEVWGHKCANPSPTQTSTYGGKGFYPKDNTISMWGKAFGVDKSGYARSRASPHVGGQIVCP